MPLMADRLFRQWLEPLLAPETDWIQIEVSSFCNASCIYCPRTVYRDQWQDRHLSLKTFELLLPAIRNTDLVFLQGWGEPLLNPNFFEMVHLAKEAGCRVGTTTNGLLLDGWIMDNLLASGIDIVAFSLAGLDEVNDRFRPGLPAERILSVIRRLDQKKKELRFDKPDIHLSYLLLRSGLSQLRQLPKILSGNGISQVVISTLDFIPSADLEPESLYPDSVTAYAMIRADLDELAATAAECGLDVRDNFAPFEGRKTTCSENPQGAFFISSDGLLSPCVFTCLPVSGSNAHGSDAPRPYVPLVFGDINRDCVSSIWKRREYVAFRKSFDSGHAVKPCLSCKKLRASADGTTTNLP